MLNLAVLTGTTRAGISEFSLVYRYVKSTFSSVPAIFSYSNKEPKILVRLADSRDKLCDVASNAAYQKTHVLCLRFTYVLTCYHY